jgi:hypothetical protein
MDIDKVRLSDAEIAKVCHVAIHNNPHWQLDAWGLYMEVAKAAQLKLLNMLKQNYQLPKDAIVYPNLLVMSGQQVDELEKLLKGE